MGAIEKKGKSVLPHGTVYNAFERILNYLRGIGLHVVEIGELECFVRNVGNKGPEWVNGALEVINSEEPPDLTFAKKFVNQLVN